LSDVVQVGKESVSKLLPDSSKVKDFNPRIDFNKTFVWYYRIVFWFAFDVREITLRPAPSQYTSFRGVRFDLIRIVKRHAIRWRIDPD